MIQQLMLIVCIAGAFAALGYIAVTAWLNGQGGKLRTRLSAEQQQEQTPAPRTKPGVMPILQKFSSAAAQPLMPTSREKQSTLRKQLGYAGVYSASAIKIMQGAKMILLVTGLLGGYLGGLAMNNTLLGLGLGGLLGYVGPTLWLKLKIKSNQKALTHGLADALDLMVVCVEAGLTVDLAMQRVGQELAIAHPALSRELGIAHMETRVGLPRAETLKNMGTRTGNADLQSLASMLIQADRFGTSIANALRVQSETIRLQRHHAAEELAAKASVKMSFPLVLFIFPATFIVLAGPTVIRLLESDFMK